MPELPEVETVVRGLRPLLQGLRLDHVEARRPDLRWPLPVDLGQRLIGAHVTAIRRRAKFGLLDTDRGDTLLFHLGMSGRFRPLEGEPGKHDHILFFAGSHRLAFHDPRRFGAVDLALTAKSASHPWLAGLGPEPLEPEFGADALARALAGRRAPVRSLLLDQRIVAGLGNIYVSEALHQAGIDPLRPAGAVNAAEIGRLVAAIRAVLESAIEAGGSTLRDHAQVSGEMGYFQHDFRVYGRDGGSCATCGGTIRRRVQGGRSSFDCPSCQR